MIELSQAIVLFVFALFVGAYGTLVGAGGGFLIVPMLLLVFHTSPQEAIGTSLTVVFFNALSGTFSYARHKRIDYKTGYRFALATIPGSIVGAYVSSLFSGRFFSILFGVLLVVLAIFLAVRPTEARPSAKGSAGPPPGYAQRVLIDLTGEKYEYAFNEPAGIGLSFVVGFLSSILGIGGGIIHVPALVYLFSFPAHIATATSHFILAISAFIGSASHLALGHVILPYALVMAVGVMIGAQAGARLSLRLKGSLIVRLLSLALVVVGIRLLLGQVASG